jgi:hypothetical protein
MPDRPDTNSSQDREIARYFAGMRDADARQAPPVPSAQVLARRSPLVVESRFSAAMPGLAAAVILVVAVGLLTLDTSPRDPGALYADIMGESNLLTDPLLSVSPGMSPEMIDTVGAFDMEVSVMELN